MKKNGETGKNDLIISDHSDWKKIEDERIDRKRSVIVLVEWR